MGRFGGPNKGTVKGQVRRSWRNIYLLGRFAIYLQFVGEKLMFLFMGDPAVIKVLGAISSWQVSLHAVFV